MSRNSSGTYTRITPPGPSGYVGGVGNPIYASQINGEYNDITSEITDSLSRSGKGAMLANLDMGGFAITNTSSVFASGTRLAFFQAAAPLGWTQLSAVDCPTNSMLRCVSTAGGGTGGTDSAIYNDKVISHTHSFTGTAFATHVQSGTYTVNFGTSETVAQQDTAINITPTGTIAAPAGAVAGWSPKYIDMIVAERDA